LNIYVDTSFLVSLYSLDSNSVAAVRIMDDSDGQRFVTTLGVLEVINALELRVFRRELAVAQAQSSLNDFERHLGDGVFQLRGFPDTVFEQARRMSLQTTAKMGTRTGDLLHVAAALELGADYLYSFDQKQRKLAQAVRLKVNPDVR
jgi:predicted nucleic acid-binding protein